ncbi:MAG: DUF4442 domain-containing protein [Candidatus Marinimicrobia bacterium]|nr:DUF4442 domain-containing protein [Candidatus Neomarinimicrobiota bacterium]
MRFTTIKQTNRTLWALGFFKIPLIFFCRPKVHEISDEKCVIKIPFRRSVKNHVNSMYIGALTIGADLAGGFLAMRHIETTGKKIVLIFKDMHADYLKLVEGDAYFTCNDGDKVKEAVRLAAETGERQNVPVNITVTVPSQMGDEPVAKYTLTLSIKDKG